MSDGIHGPSSPARDGTSRRILFSHAHLPLFGFCILAVSFGLDGPVWAQEASLPGEASLVQRPSTELEANGDATVGERVPWFAGWTSTGSIYNQTMMLEAPGRGTVMVFAASWCEPCLAGLATLTSGAELGALPDVTLLVVVVEQDISAMVEWLDLHRYVGVTIHDRYFAVAEVFGVLANGSGAGELSLPRTVVVDRDGIVRTIVAREGSDYIDLIMTRISGAMPDASPPPLPGSQP